MCGIVGYCGYVPEGKWGETYRLLECLFLEAESRGKDAAGFVAARTPLKRQGKRSIVTDKQPLPASRFLRESKAWRSLRHHRCTMVLGHSRWATHGDPRNNENNGPQGGDKGLYLAHNGVVSNYLDVAEKYGLRLTSDCDSEVILRIVELAPHPALGLALCLRECGSMAAAVYDGRANVVWLARNRGRPLAVARMVNDRRVFFASTPEIITQGFEEAFGSRLPRWDFLLPLGENRILALRPDGTLIDYGAVDRTGLFTSDSETDCE